MEYASTYHHEITGQDERRSWLDYIEKTWEFFLYSSLYLGIAAAGMAYVTCLIEGAGFSLPAAAILGLVVFSVYNLNRKTDEAEDALNHACRHRITSTFSRPLLAMAVVAYAAALCLAAPFGIAALGITLVPLIAGSLYSLPLLPPTTGYSRLKEVPVGKNLVVSFSWGFSFSLLPVAIARIDPGPATLAAFFFIFSWTFIASVLPDTRDRAGDAATGVVTIPVLLGVPWTRRLLSAFNFISGFLLLVPWTIIPSRIGAGLIAVSLMYSQACIIAIGRTCHEGFLCDVVSDGQFIPIALLGFLVARGFPIFGSCVL
ncbi:MAG TPA: UbiA family prenyltransferase [Methanolinea sp.]|nr:UbiA family prenyltransferase [Methanolinea sp.]